MRLTAKKTDVPRRRRVHGCDTFINMLTLQQLRIDALLIVLVSAACVMAALRVAELVSAHHVARADHEAVQRASSGVGKQSKLTPPPVDHEPSA
jgi:hypothetical protein